MLHSSNMTRTRLFIGLTSAVYGASAVLLTEGGIAKLMVKGTWEDWTWPTALIVFGLLMAFAATRELAGERRRACRTIGSFLLGCVWMAVLFQTLADNKPDPLTLQAPLYVAFCLWAWVQDAFIARVHVITSKGTTT